MFFNTYSSSFSYFSACNKFCTRIYKWPLTNTKMGLVHIAGYVTRNDPDISEEELFDVTTFYYGKFGGYTEQLDRGQLNIPTDCAVQWSFFSFIIFQCVKDSVCRSSLSKIFSRISEHYKFGMTSHHSRILSNIFLKKHCLDTS